MSCLRVESVSGKTGWRIRGEDTKLIEHANAFLTTLTVKGLSPRTSRAYAYDLLSLTRWTEQTSIDFENIQASDVLKYVGFLQENGAETSTINRRLTSLGLFHRFVTGRDLPSGLSTGGYYRGRGRDHALGLHNLGTGRRRLKIKAEEKLVEPLTPTEVLAFLASLKRYRDMAITQLMLLCGLRSIEVRRLRIDDVVLNYRRLIVRGKGERERALPLPAMASQSIDKYLRLERPLDATTTSLFVVLQGNRRGNPMTAEGLRSLFRFRRLKTNLARANPHRFRHTFGADMARCGVRLPVLQKLMGHSDSKTTLQYINLSMSDIADAYAEAINVIEKRYQGDALEQQLKLF